MVMGGWIYGWIYGWVDGWMLIASRSVVSVRWCTEYTHKIVLLIEWLWVDGYMCGLMGGWLGWWVD